jgi:hypothetical protein
VIGIAMSEHLRLAGEAAESACVNDASAVALKGGTIGVRRLRKSARRKRIVRGVRDSAASGESHGRYCLLVPFANVPDDSFARRTRALSSFFCTLLTSPGSASAGTVRAY